MKLNEDIVEHIVQTVKKDKVVQVSYKVLDNLKDFLRMVINADLDLHIPYRVEPISDIDEGDSIRIEWWWGQEVGETRALFVDIFKNTVILTMYNGSGDFNDWKYEWGDERGINKFAELAKKLITLSVSS